MSLASVGNHLWQSTLFAVSAWVLVQAFQKNGARVRYLIWMLASVKFLLPLSLLMALGGHFSVPADRHVAPVNVPVIEFIAQPFSAGALQQESLAMPAETSTLTHGPSTMTDVLATIWLLGGAAVVLFWLIRTWRVRQIQRAARGLDHGREIEALERVKRRRGFDLRIRCAVTESVIEPGVHGVFLPTLLLPLGLAERLEDDQLDTIITHELCHIRRRDNMVGLLHMMVETVFWFHPLIWKIGSRLIDERERSCDEEVLASGGDPKVYAAAILRVCEYYVASPLPFVAGVMGSDLKGRIETIMANKTVVNLSAGKKALLATFGMLLIGLPMVAGSLGIGLQTIPEPTAFEVAAVKPNTSTGGPGSRSLGCHGTTGEVGDPTPQGRCVVRRFPLRWIIAFAYDVPLSKIKQDITGGPDWIDSEMYDIDAKAAGDETTAQLKAMMRTLLADRFKLKIRTISKTGRGFALMVEPAGSRLKASADPQTTTSSFTERTGVLTINNGRISELVSSLSAIVEAPVVDRTALSGSYDVSLKWSPDNIGFIRQTATEVPGQSIFTALREQLGLRLESQPQVPFDTFVIDFVVKPE